MRRLTAGLAIALLCLTACADSPAQPDVAPAPLVASRLMSPAFALQVLDAPLATAPRLIPSPVPGNTLVWIDTYFPGQDVYHIGRTITYDQFANMHLELYKRAVATNDPALTRGMYGLYHTFVIAGVTDATVEGIKAFFFLNSERMRHPQWSDFAPLIR